MRDLILASLKQHLEHHGNSGRWNIVKTLLIPFWDNNPALKKSKKDIRNFNVLDFDYNTLNDIDLLKIYRYVLYQYTKMY